MRLSNNPKTMVLVVLLWLSNSLQAQNPPLTLDTCYALARQNYPLIKKQTLIQRSSQFSLENASKIHLPQFNVNGQASYQSQTISFAKIFPAMPTGGIPEISKDQYKIQAELTQSIYDGGLLKNQQNIIKTNEKAEQEQLAVQLNGLNERIDQIYFSILLLNEQLLQNELRKKDIEQALDKARKAVQEGTAYRSNADELEAAIILVNMASVELHSGHNAFRDMLGLFIGIPLGNDIKLTLPPMVQTPMAITRPELRLYEARKNLISAEEQQIKTSFQPKVSAFALAAYGRPTLNFIENKFGAWWMAGLRLNWSFGGLYTFKNQKNILAILRQNLDLEKETFLLNTNMNMNQQMGLIQKYKDLLLLDEQVIEFRQKINQSAKAQWENGVITVHEYLTKLNDENLAKQTLIQHEVQLVQARYQLKTMMGN